MKSFNYTFFLLGYFLHACTTPSVKASNYIEPEPHNLRTDLEEYNGYYSTIENEGGILHRESLSEELIHLKPDSIRIISIEHLRKIRNGYNLLFNMNFSGTNLLVVSTLDTTYSMIDYRVYPNGTENKDEMDTIAIPTFSDQLVEIQLMHPNLNEEPTYEVNGIKRESLTIGDNLKLYIETPNRK